MACMNIHTSFHSFSYGYGYLTCHRLNASLANRCQKRPPQWKCYPLRWRHNDHAGVSNHQPHGCLLNRLFRRKSKKTSKLRVTGLCAGNSPGTGEYPAQMASYAENVSIWWRHHALPSKPFLFVGLTELTDYWRLSDRSIGQCTKDETPLLTRWCYLFRTITHRDNTLAYISYRDIYVYLVQLKFIVVTLLMLLDPCDLSTFSIQLCFTEQRSDPDGRLVTKWTDV